ncbi:Protease PrsW [Limihaloglobus sulfuriphilus]|uniref:Protease PrsW n=1 Tax=Limihaloglobus sulfuriphilus TaxID=1851148 RepID=A0A1Q2MEI0_9BACT|nr:PrsW family glutamic-type intramembrane protease [Limihaloglobus sulfuriphilus]AQQ70662.1 Protease PrsW [Limihaloglobus sulfuriphilus]
MNTKNDDIALYAGGLEQKQSKPFPLSRLILYHFLIPTAIIITAVNFFLGDSYKSSPQDRLEQALSSNEFEEASLIYQKLLKDDFSSINLHRDYLRNQSLINDFSHDNTAYSDTVNTYFKYATSKDPLEADIGNYAIGYLYSLNGKYWDSLIYYSRVNDRQMPFLNNSIGYCLLQLGERKDAMSYFYKEIEADGNIAGACMNLVEILYEDKNFELLERLISNPRTSPHISIRLKRITHIEQQQPLKYLAALFNYSHVLPAGLAASILVLAVWFFYLRKLDVFEPEKYRYMLLMLAGGMICAEFCTFFYDITNYSLGFNIGRGMFNDLLYCIFAIGLIEEAVKIIPFLIMLRYSKEINEPVDYLIYASVSALGFAFVENLLYFNESGLASITGRAFTAVLLHMSMSTFAVYGLLYTKYFRKNNRPVFWLSLSFSAAVLVHGLYDFWLIANVEEQYRLFSIIILIAATWKFSTIIKNSLSISAFNLEEKNRVLHLTRYLAYSLMAIILMQYVLIAVQHGALKANINMLQGISAFYFLLFVLIMTMGNIQLKPNKTHDSQEMEIKTTSLE